MSTELFNRENFTAEKDPSAETILSYCAVSTKMMAKTFFPHLFYAPFSEHIHDPIFQRIDNQRPRVGIAAPRGTGKTTICSIAKCSQAILFRQRHFIVYVSKTFDHAAMQTENLKYELMSNSEVKELFGNVKISDKIDGLDESFSKKAWVAYGNTLILPRGAGQQIRGVLWHGWRPDLFIFDDLEDDKEIESDENRQKLKVWFHSNPEKAVSRLDRSWKMIYIDTLKHEDALLQDILDEPEWDSIRLELFDDNRKSLAPEFISNEEIEKEYEYHRREGMLDVLYREFRNLPISTEDATFKQEYFKYYEERELTGKFIENVVIVDPAKTAKLHSADSAIVCWGVDLESRALYFRDCVHGKMLPDELYSNMFQMAERFRTRIVGVEVTGLNEFILQPIKNEMSVRGSGFELIELKARGQDKGKDLRIASLVPYYRQGYIYHNQTVSGALEAQLLSFPRSKLKDVSDAAAYIVEMLELGERYFMPIESYEDPEDEFAGVEYDKPVMDWRIA